MLFMVIVLEEAEHASVAVGGDNDLGELASEVEVEGDFEVVAAFNR